MLKIYKLKKHEKKNIKKHVYKWWMYVTEMFVSEFLAVVEIIMKHYRGHLDNM